MPWCRKARKDVASCDKLREGAHNRRSEDFRMGQPSPGYAGLSSGENIAWGSLTKRIETSQYLQENKTIVISLVAASERERA